MTFRRAKGSLHRCGVRSDGFPVLTNGSAFGMCAHLFGDIYLVCLMTDERSTSMCFWRAAEARAILDQIIEYRSFDSCPGSRPSGTAWADFLTE